MPEQNGGRLDRAIDRAVRDMVQVDPRPGLSDRVEERLLLPGSVFHRGLLVPALAAAAAIVVLLGAAGLLRSPAPATAPPAAIAQAPAISPAPEAGAPPDVSAPEPALPAPRVAPRGARAPRNIFGSRSDRISAANVDIAPAVADTEAVPVDDAPFADGGMPPLSPIAITPIRLTPIAVSPVTVNALPGGK